VSRHRSSVDLYRGSVISVADLGIRYGEADVTIGVLADRVHQVIAILDIDKAFSEESAGCEAGAEVP
jgi:hypothetical protein